MWYALLLCLLLVPAAVSAGSSSIDRSRIITSGTAGEIASERVRVTNTATIGQRYTLSASEALSGSASMNPAQFTLGPGQSQDAVLRFRMPPETQKAHITLVARDLRQSGPLEVANGIRVPVELIPSQVAGASARSTASGASGPLLSAPRPWTVAVYVIDGILITVAAYLMRRRASSLRGPEYKISFV